MNKSLNQLVNVIKDIATRHKQIAQFGFGPTHQIGETTEMQYPYFWATLQPNGTITSTNNKLKTVELDFTFIVADRINNVISDELGENNTNGLEVLNDTQLIIFDIVSEINNHPFYSQNRISIVDDISISPSYDERDDKINAYTADVTLTMPFDHKWCSNPIDYTSFSASIQPQDKITVLVKDSDGDLVLTQKVWNGNSTITLAFNDEVAAKVYNNGVFITGQTVTDALPDINLSINSEVDAEVYDGNGLLLTTQTVTELIPEIHLLITNDTYIDFNFSVATIPNHSITIDTSTEGIYTTGVTTNINTYTIYHNGTGTTYPITAVSGDTLQVIGTYDSILLASQVKLTGTY